MGVDMSISRVGQCVIFVCVPLRAEGKIKTSASSRTCNVLSNQTVKSDFTDILPSLQSPPAPPPVLRRSQLLVGSAHYLQNSNGIIRYLTVQISDMATAVHKLWCGLHCWNMLVFRQLLPLSHARNSPSAVPCTKRYFTEWKFLALSVTVEFCTKCVQSD